MKSVIKKNTKEMKNNTKGNKQQDNLLEQYVNKYGQEETSRTLLQNLRLPQA
jgi:hypothetical protein